MAQDKPDAKELVPTSHAVEFSNVTYEYTPGNPVLHNVSFSIPGGKTLALVGATGSGECSQLRPGCERMQIGSSDRSCMCKCGC